jgi:hypothetical protein
VRRRSFVAADARYRTALVGHVATLREINQDEDIFEWVRDNHDPADRDVEGFDDDSAATILEHRGGRINGLDQPVRLVSLLRREHDFCGAMCQSEACCTDLVVAPTKFVPEYAAVEVESRVEVRNRNGDGVDGLKKWCRAHPLTMPALGRSCDARTERSAHGPRSAHPPRELDDDAVPSDHDQRGAGDQHDERHVHPPKHEARHNTNSREHAADPHHAHVG